LQNKDLPEDLDDPHQIDPDHVGSDAEMENDAHDDTYTDDSEVDVDADDDDDDDDVMVMMMMRQLLVATNDIHDHIDCIMDHFLYIVIMPLFMVTIICIIFTATSTILLSCIILTYIIWT
jgi:hypothetical protein